MQKNKFKPIAAGVGLGALNGLFGGGGGMVCVPLLQNTLQFKKKEAHATAILIIAPVCLISAIIYVAQGYVVADVVIPAAVGNVAGGLLGAEALGKLPEFWVDMLFIVVMAAAGIRMVIG